MKPRSFPTSGAEDPFELLYSRLRNVYLTEIEPFPRSVLTRHEQSLSLLDSHNKAVERAVVLIPGNARQLITWREPFHKHPVLEYCARHFFVDQLEELSMPLCLGELRRYMGNLHISPKATEAAFVSAVDQWIRDVTDAAKATKDPRLVGLVKSFVEFCVEGEYWGWPEHLLCSLPLNADIRRHSRSAETLLDRDFGPYTQEEVLAISNGLWSTKGVSAFARAKALVFRDWGARPIQLVLMREEDFGSDHGDPYLDIPGAKGRSRSRLKRSEGNFKRRPITEETAQAITEMIAANQALIENIKQQLSEEFPKLAAHIANLPASLFPPDRLYLHMRECVADPKLREYTLHNRSSYLADEVRKLSRKLAIPQTITSGTETDTRILRIRASRFRKTKATQMVLQGYSPDEVAEALDHTDVNSVRHYFRFNQDVIDYVNATQNSSPEVSSMVKSWLDGWSTNISAVGGTEVRVSKIKSLGRCGNNNVCDKHPTVSCYSCPSFTPSRTADHAGAAAAIDAYATTVGANSTGPVRQQLLFAVRNAKQLAEEQAKLDKVGHRGD